ncbi:hypothetical protein MB46_10255 [Arthrobacter alpinus]|uniref:hypothetical protein n=1 Tax=Arthrobacter alpinus TaxID=656366 RepID=UPI0005CB5007|nr:hypothetical protein [Arthrobacter alpinus]ALV45803.1 hypothetical protein MB46_10255 [Arthrobacter alpinus]
MNSNKRFSVWPIFTRHYKGLVPAGRRHLQAKTVVYLFVIPAIIGALTFIAGTSLSALEPAIAGLGVLAGGFLAGFILLMELRVKIRETESYRVHLGRMIGRTAASAMYLMVLCILTLMLIIVAGVIVDALPETWTMVQHIVSGLAVAGLVHISTTGLTFLRRLFSVYAQMFSGDFAPELQSVDQPTHDISPNRRRA